MRKAKVVDRPQQPPAEPHCGVCHLTLDYLAKRAGEYECSRIDCPQRRQVTAQPPDRMPIFEGHGKTPMRNP